MVKRAKQHVHFIGIGGSGISAIARLLLESGYTVSGSDRTRSPFAQKLAEAGARVMAGHAAENVQGANVVVRSSAVPDDNIEVIAAQAAGIPVLKRAQFLGRLMEDHLGIAVAGSHGKTTTTAMITWMLVRLGLDPSYIIGGTAKDLGGSNAHAGSGQPFVIEADEYDHMFLGLNPDIIVVTSMEYDHPDCFPTPADYQAAFEQFVQRLRRGGVLLADSDDPGARGLTDAAPGETLALTYGTGAQADYLASNITRNSSGGYAYDAYWHEAGEKQQFLAHVSLHVPGEHNLHNSLGALAAVHQLLPPENLEERLQAAAQALSAFSGTGRRFDLLGEVQGIAVIDDYAHHPTKVQATLAAARARYPERRIWAVWQPHTFSRTRGMMDQFARSFGSADRVLVTEVYAARENAASFENFSAAQVVERMQHPGAQFSPTLEETSATLLANLQPGDVLLVLSAGDADQVSAAVLAGLKERKANHG